MGGRGKGKGKGKGGKGKGKKGTGRGDKEKAANRPWESRKRTAEEAGLPQDEDSGLQDDCGDDVVPMRVKGGAERPAAEDEPPAKRMKAEDNEEEGGDKRKKVKVALIFGYLGSNYQGLQINPGAHTVEKVLEEAIVKVGGISHSNSFAACGELSKVQWTRCGRTDKGVHAAGQVVGLRILPSDALLEDLNATLPEDIRVFAITRVTKAFNAKNHCSGRSYLYMLPMDAVPHKFGEEAAIAKLNTILQCYVGTRNYHNFTSKAKGKKVSSANDAAAQRYITEVQCGEPLDAGGMRFLPIHINGQSFLFNQIRHMVALALLIYRAGSGTGVMDRCFSAKEPDIQFPMVPGEFLLLDKCHYRDYQKKVEQHDSDLSFQKGQAARDTFVKDTICEHMAQLEAQRRVMEVWLHWVYSMAHETYKPIFEVISANGGKLGKAGGNHMPPQKTFIDPITNASFTKKSAHAQFMHMRHTFHMW